MTKEPTAEQRSKIMASIHSKGTKPEMMVRRYLFACGFRFRVNSKRLPGSPDIVLRKYRTCIFVNGCFWHGHENCPKYHLPKTNVEFWDKKIARNKQRDIEVQRKLAKMGWHVMTVWECQLDTKAKREQTLTRIEYTLNHIFLMDREVRYRLPDDTDVTMAAEEIHKG